MLNKNTELLFFTKWLQAPLSVASVAPSSPRLARAMASCLPEREGLVIELGGGTGSITRALLHTGLNPAHLVVVERDPYFCRYLRQRFPEVKIICGDARCLAALITDLLHRYSIRSVVSGLPILSMSAGIQHQLLEQSLELSENQGSFIQFSYALTSPVKKNVQKKLGLTSRCVAYVWRNIPPAKVWVYERIKIENHMTATQKVA